MNSYLKQTKTYLNTVAINDNIIGLELNQALEKFILSTINPHILVCIILYFYT
ncbi:7803_t:CDS:2 [Cetraspora pellucida]|uniref:7803_t:CDS:1 n=1 Tax=Cetraspora pellucida TaxID=1433469 RepID=A0A9N9AAT4_9GLOM|nr:7803_t:CDS:2 [Cetraspora pellucida]